MTRPHRAVGRALLHIQSDLAGGEQEFTRWCNDVHHAEALRAPGFLAVRRFELVPGYRYEAPGGSRFLTLYELDREGALDSDAYRANTESATPLPAAVAGLTYLRTVYRQCHPDSGRLVPDGTVEKGDQTVGAAILHVMMDIEPDWDGELNAWYAEEHLPRLLSVPGMLGARRFVDAGWSDEGSGAHDGRHKYLAVYELTDERAVESDAYADASQMTPRTAALAPHLAFYSQIYREVFALTSAR